MNTDDVRARRELRHRGRQIQTAIRSLLLEWDPIGGVPEDEYDCMIGPLHGQLSKGATAEEVAAWLGAHNDEHFGLTPEPETDSALAQRLVAAWQNIEPSRAE